MAGSDKDPFSTGARLVVQSEFITSNEEAMVERLERHQQSAAKATNYLACALIQRAEILFESYDPGAAADLDAAIPRLIDTLGEDHREVKTARDPPGAAQEPDAV